MGKLGDNCRYSGAMVTAPDSFIHAAIARLERANLDGSRPELAELRELAELAESKLVTRPRAFGDRLGTQPETSTPKPKPTGEAAQVGPWLFDPRLTFLNHGSYGAVPLAALEYQSQLRARIESDPVRFYKVDLERMLDETRQDLGRFLNCRAMDLAFVPNATIALCTVLQNIGLEAGDEVLVTDHEYQSLPNELERICQRTGAKVVTAAIPFPVADPAVVIERMIACITPRTRIAFISHVTSCSALIFPVSELVKEFNARGIEVCIDGAHSPGQVPVDIAAMKPTYFIGSGHKWLSGPKGIGFMYVRSDKQAGFRPLQLSSRAAKVRPERALFLRDFDYQGTLDYSHVLTLPTSMGAVGRLLAGGWPALMRSNHEKLMNARDVMRPLLAEAGCAVDTCPDKMAGAMTSIIIPEPAAEKADRPTLYDDALQDALYERHAIVTPVWRLTATNSRVVRVSAHVYNTTEQYAYFAACLAEELRRER